MPELHDYTVNTEEEGSRAVAARKPSINVNLIARVILRLVKMSVTFCNFLFTLNARAWLSQVTGP